MMAAESGYAAAQFNVAYLCEHTVSYWYMSWSLVALSFIHLHHFYRYISLMCVQQGFLDPDFASDCMWRYYNLTIQNQNPDSYGK